MKTKHTKSFRATSSLDAEVLETWREFVAPDSHLRLDAVLKRGWAVLPVVEGVVADMGGWLLNALRFRGVGELLICLGDRSAEAGPTSAGWIDADEEGLRFLQDAAFRGTYFVTDSQRQFCWLQIFTDMYLLAGEIDFIRDVQNCSFKTSLDRSLRIAHSFGESEASPGPLLRTCMRYEQVFPAGVACSVDTEWPRRVAKAVEPAKISMPPLAGELIAMRDGVPFFSPCGLHDRGWKCVPFELPLDDEIFDWVCDAERLSRAANTTGDNATQVFLLDEQRYPNSFRVQSSREGLLGFAELTTNGNVLMTNTSEDFAILGAAQSYILLAGDSAQLQSVVGGELDLAFDMFDAALDRLSSDNPHVADILGDVLLEYLELV